MDRNNKLKGIAEWARENVGVSPTDRFPNIKSAVSPQEPLDNTKYNEMMEAERANSELSREDWDAMGDNQRYDVEGNPIVEDDNPFKPNSGPRY